MRYLYWLIPAAIIALGIGVTVLALLYGALIVGVPYPDLTPAQAAAEDRYLSLSGHGFLAGLILTALGILLLSAVALACLCRQALALVGRARATAGPR